MAVMTTREIIDSYLNCKYKAHLKLTGQQGTRSDYELLLAESREEVRRRAIDKILSCQPAPTVERDVVLSPAALMRGNAYLLNATLEDNIFSLAFDGLKRMPGPSKLGDFHYIPLLFFAGRQVRKSQRALLDIYGLLLARIQGRASGIGIIWHGKDCRATRVRLSPEPRKAERMLAEIQHMQGAGEPPRLLLNVHCAVCEFRQRCCHKAIEEDNISLLRGMKEKETWAYARKGILTVTQLAHTFRPRRKGKRTPPRFDRHSHSLQALAIRDKKVYVFGTPQLPVSPVRIYLDVEGCPDEGYDYLVGLIIVEGDKEQRFSFWADDRDQEDWTFQQFLATVTNYADFLVFAYGGYERAFVRRMQKRAERKTVADRVLKSMVNVNALIYAHVYFPTCSNGLKDVGASLGCSWTDPNASGIQSIVWRMRWEATHDEHWKQQLLTYNMEDCVALRRVTEFLYSISATSESAQEPRTATESKPRVARVEEIDRLGSVNRRGKIQFFHPDYEYINNCAHFDYQRQRVYVRTSRMLKKNRKKPRRYRNRKLRVSQRVQIVSKKCPSCGGMELIHWERGKKVSGYSTKRKKAFDLVFTSGGIKRRVIECRTSIHECLQCGKIFIPDRYQGLAKHFHGLMSWAMYEHVAHRIGCPMVKEMFQDFFGLAVCHQEITKFKSIMARYYRPGYKKLLDKIMSGQVLHVDETEMKLRTGKGYVWVFATAEDVVYLYRPNREGDFLLELLKDFRGVLVSDFYTAYDSLNCPQQKCLIHLMRDMNQELLDNPFDEELQSITGPFGTLLRAIVGTIDQHGLRRRFLGKHELDVAKFFQALTAQSFRSEAAEALRARLIKYQEKLFTFLRYDMVPWNNNNAENAIRRFAYYREDTPGRLKEAGLRDYLALLSFCHTCRYKSVSFLKFLLSRKQDVDTFCQGRRRKRRPKAIEIYPKGVVRPDFAGAKRGTTEPNKTRE